MYMKNSFFWEQKQVAFLLLGDLSNFIIYNDDL